MQDLLFAWIIFIINSFLLFVLRKKKNLVPLLLLLTIILGIVATGITAFVVGDTLHDAGYF